MKQITMFAGLDKEEAKQQQLIWWGKGRPVCDIAYGRCCPDFSCCGLPIFSDRTRNSFLHAYQDKDYPTMTNILNMGLESICVNANISVQVDIEEELTKICGICCERYHVDHGCDCPESQMMY